MRVLKFGGTSVANAERFYALPIFWKATPNRDRSPPCSLRQQNHQSHGGDDRKKTISGQDAQPNISDAERIFSELLQGLAEAARF